MQLYLFHRSDRELLDPGLSTCSGYHKDVIKGHASFILGCQHRKPDSIISVPRTRLDIIASLHCDKWIEETALHMNLYAHARQTPQLMQSQTHQTSLGKLPTITQKSFSGDASGVIGEALFVFTLTEYLGVDEDGFTHFGASKSTGIFPDFGIHATSKQLQTGFEEHGIDGPDLTQTHLIPAEVKAMTNPDLRIVQLRLDKAIQQIRNFWKTRKLGLAGEKPIEPRGASIVFLALRNSSRGAYDGVIMWMG